MTNPLRDILINARQESIRMQHYYIGVEHLFIGMLALQNGLTGALIEEQGLTPDYLIDAIRRTTGKGVKLRMWAGLPNSPRADIVLSIANDLAIERGKDVDQISERDLLLAVMEENDSVPLRVLRKLNVDTAVLKREAANRQPKYEGRQSYVQIEFSPSFSALDALNDDHLFILRRMFYGHDRIRIEKKLAGGYSSAVLLLITPTNSEGMEEAPVVAKIDAQDLILDEAQRYDLHVRGSLPSLTARLEDKPTTADACEVAGLRYTFVAPPNGRDGSPMSVRELGAEKIGHWLKSELFPTFGKTWWMQRHSYRFQVWSEYDYLLPPVLTIEFQQEDPANPPKHVLRDPIRRGKLAEIEYGDVIAIEGFTVQRVFRDKGIVHIANGRGSDAAKRAYKISVRGMNLSDAAYYRGEPIERIVGRVWKNRDELLHASAGAIYPDFDTHAAILPGIPEADPLPNPLTGYTALLEQYVNGTLSKIHGDLHLGNVLVGTHEAPFLIDFAEARVGHVLMDWASLEMSALAEFVVPVYGSNWESVREAARGLYAINRGETIASSNPDHDAAFRPIKAIRSIAGECLNTPDKWGEYQVALAMCSLRAITWDTMSVGGRRLLLYTAALAFHELQSRPSRTGFDTDTDMGGTPLET